jgi:predicted transcriptional regulator
MKTRNLTIGIQPFEEGVREFIAAVESFQEGRPYTKKSPDVCFTSLDAVRNVLTPKRLQLLRLIRELEPDSVYELARAAKRDLKNVSDDVALLARIELVSLSRSKTRRKRVIPRVGYDRLQLQIAIG